MYTKILIQQFVNFYSTPCVGGSNPPLDIVITQI